MTSSPLVGGCAVVELCADLDLAPAVKPPTTTPSSRVALLAKTIKRNKTCKHFGAVQDGTIAKLDALRSKSGLSMDNLLYKMARTGERMGV